MCYFFQASKNLHTLSSETSQLWRHLYVDRYNFIDLGYLSSPKQEFIESFTNGVTPVTVHLERQRFQININKETTKSDLYKSLLKKWNLSRKQEKAAKERTNLSLTTQGKNWHDFPDDTLIYKDIHDAGLEGYAYFNDVNSESSTKSARCLIS